MTNTITYEGRTFTLDEYYEHPEFGRLRFVGSHSVPSGFFRREDGRLLALRYDEFPLPEPETVTVTLRVLHGVPWTHRFTHDEARAAIKALQDALPGDDVWVRVSREDALHFQEMRMHYEECDCEKCRRVTNALTEALER